MGRLPQRPPPPLTILQNDDWFQDPMEKLDVLCSSDNLSLPTLREIIETHTFRNRGLGPSNGYPFFDKVCNNKNVTLEIIQYLLDWFPNAIGRSTQSLHIACYNKNCPNEVIELLIKRSPASSFCENYVTVPKNGAVIRHMLPLHCYLARKSNMKYTVVKMLVEVYPKALVVDKKGCIAPIYISTSDLSTNDLTDLSVLVYQRQGSSVKIVDSYETLFSGETQVMKFAPIHYLLCNYFVTDTSTAHNVINLQVLTYLLESNPSAIHLTNNVEETLLNSACGNLLVDLEVVQLLINAWPEANRIRNSSGYMPIHMLCCIKGLEEAVSLDVLRFMLNTDRTLLREDVEGWLPIHLAVGHMSTAFCKELINGYPESLRVRAGNGMLPIHRACIYCDRADSVDTIQYLLHLYPESIGVRDGQGYLPIHKSVLKGKPEIVELLLTLNPADASSRDDESGKFLLHTASSCNRSVGLVGIVKNIFDAYPEAILALDGEGKTPLDHAIETERSNPSQSQSMTIIISFLHAQQVYARIAHDTTALTSVDENGWLPLHHALKDNATLGSIKLLLTGNVASLQLSTHEGVYPIQIACEHSSVKVVKILHELSGHTLDQYSPLQYACRGGNCAVIKYLFGSHASLVASAVVTSDGNNKLPIHLLCQAGKEEDKVDCNSTEYIEAIWMVLLSDPAEMMTALVL